MKSQKHLYTFFIITFLLSCGTSKETSKNEGNDITVTVTRDKSNSVNNPDLTISLADHLRKIPGVMVKGSTNNDIIIYVRSGGNTLTQSNNPLFIVNGQQFNGEFRELANTIDVNLIKKITVLKDASDTSFYGIRGANGVILIDLKDKI